MFVFDDTYTNVALGKETNGSAQNTLDTVQYTTGMAVNGIIAMDTPTSSDMTSSAACDGTGWWSVDLGGVYNLTKVRASLAGVEISEKRFGSQSQCD